MQWVYRTVDSVFLRDQAGEPLMTGEAATVVPRRPNIELERYGDPSMPIRLVTAAEVAAAAAATTDSRAGLLTDDVVAKAIVRAIAEELQKYTLKAGQTAKTLPEWRDRIKALIAASL